MPSRPQERSPLAAPPVIDGMTDMLDAHDLWEGFLFGAIPEPYKGMLKDLAGTEGLKEVAKLQKLTELYLMFTQITCAGIENFEKLKQLEEQKLQITKEHTRTSLITVAVKPREMRV